MKPILFPATSTSWTSNGLGALSDAISCVVYEERNGEYELTMTYPVGGIHFDEIHDRAIIYAIPSPYREPQPFRIYCIDSPLNGIVTIHAHHISYDLSGIPVEPFEAGTCAMALLGLTAHSIVTNPFSVNTDKSVTAPYKLKVPTSFRACLGGQEGSILDVYGKGEYEFDKYDVNLWVNRGSDNGVKIAYGKNITDFNMEKNLESVTTGVYPFWSDLENDELVEIPGRIIKIYDPTNPTYLLESGGAYLTEAEDKYLRVQTPFNFNNILPLDLSSEFEEKPTPDELRARAEKYIKDNSLGAPRISIDVSFIDLGQTEEYKDLAGLEACDLCDTVTVEFPMYGISVKAEIVRIETDVLLERYNSVEIGDARTSIADTIAKLATDSVTKTEMRNGSALAADYINNTKGVFEWIDNGDGTNGGFTIYETDDDKSWLRCTAGGIGISADGGLTYTNAITKNGIVASQIDVQNSNGVGILKVFSIPQYSEAHIRMGNGDTLTTESGHEGFLVTVNQAGSFMRFRNPRTGNTSLHFISAYTNGGGDYGYYSYSNLYIVDPISDNHVISLDSTHQENGGTYNATVRVINVADDTLPAVMMTSRSTNGVVTNDAGVYRVAGGGYAVSAIATPTQHEFRITGINNETVFVVTHTSQYGSQMYFNGHNVTWQTKTINGVTINYLGY